MRRPGSRETNLTTHIHIEDQEDQEQEVGTDDHHGKEKSVSIEMEETGTELRVGVINNAAVHFSKFFIVRAGEK